MDGFKLFMLNKLMDHVLKAKEELEKTSNLSPEAQHYIKGRLFGNAMKTLESIGIEREPDVIEQFASVLGVCATENASGGSSSSAGSDSGAEQIPDDILQRFTRISL